MAKYLENHLQLKYSIFLKPDIQSRKTINLSNLINLLPKIFKFSLPYQVIKYWF
jgi:hypothetical protein